MTRTKLEILDFQQNQCLSIKKTCLRNIHRLAWGPYARGVPGQLSSVAMHCPLFELSYILVTTYIFIPVSGCVGRGPSALLCLGAYDAVKTALKGVHPGSAYDNALCATHLCLML
jgi:hypothetical protein